MTTSFKAGARPGDGRFANTAARGHDDETDLSFVTPEAYQLPPGALRRLLDLFTEPDSHHDSAAMG